MARSNAITNGVHANGDALPPSTLAAQIVQNQVYPQHTRQSEQQALFASLLQEILHSPTADAETDVQTNVQLIKVLVEAGLTVLINDYLFAPDILVQQAKDSISVIESTIKRQPEVLEIPVNSDGPPMCLWLFARAAAICGRRNAGHISISHLVQTMIDAVEASPKLWRLRFGIKHMLQESACEIVAAFEGFTIINQFEVSIPPTGSLSSLWTQSLGAVAASHDSQARLRDIAQACEIALQLVNRSDIPPAIHTDIVLRLHRGALRFLQSGKDTKQWTEVFRSVLQHARSDLRGDILMDMIEYHQRTAALPIQLQQFMVQHLRVATTNASGEQRQSMEILLGRSTDIVDSDSLVPALKEAMEDMRTVRPPLVAPCQRKRRQKVSLTQQTHEQAIGQAVEFFDIDGMHNLNIADQICQVYTSLEEQQQYVAWEHLVNLAVTATNAVVQVLTKLQDDQTIQGQPRLRVLYLRVVQVCILHNGNKAFDLSTSTLGRAGLQALRSSSRDVRISGGNCVAAIMQIETVSTLDDRRLLLQWMRQLSDQNVLAVQETLIPVWGHIAVRCNADELNLVLLRLIEYFGHPNSLIRGLAFTEIQSIAEVRPDTSGVEALISPYWSTIAVLVVQDLFSCPQKVQMLCDLIGKDVNDFLLLTQVYTIPHLVATKRKDILLRVAAARNATVRDVCLQPRTNFVAVMAHLISQCGFESEEFAVACLTAADKTFTGEDLGDYVKTDSTAIACEVLKLAGEQDEDNKSKAHASFSVLADLCERSPGQRRSHSKTGRSVPAFLRRHILGILTGFSSVVEAGQDTLSIRKKVVCLKATAEMIILAKEEVSNALPQVRALLQSAIEQAGLCEAAWSTWLTLLARLEPEDVELVIEQTFVLVLQHWDAMSMSLQKETHAVLSDVVKRASSVITDHVLELPTLVGIPLLSKIGNEIEKLRSGESIDSAYKAFTRRLGGENPLVVVQALKDLIAYLSNKQSTIHDIAVSEQPSSNLAELTRSLLDVSLNLSKSSELAAELCAKALGLIGCLDPNRIETTRTKKTVLVLSNFDKADEVVKWVIVLLEDYLVKAFRSVTNAQAQGFMAYVIQELLKFCGFDQDIALRPRATQTGRVSQRWQEMSENVRTTLTPFMSSKYTVTTSASFSQPQRSYPSFSPESSHSTWLRGLVYDLTWKAKGENAKILFPHLARIVRGHALVIANFLLPYIVLNIILGGTVEEVNDIKKEMLAVLSASTDNNNHFETVKLCSESLFGVLDYMTIWLQEKKKVLTETRAAAFRTGVSPGDFDEVKDMGQIDTVDKFLSTIPANIVATRAMDCGAYARALFNWEQYIRQSRSIIPSPYSSLEDDDGCYYRLHDIYAHIDEPDGLEGISAHLTILTEEQQATLHARSGRWTAAQAWYESKLINDSHNEDLQGALLHCLQETGRYSTLMRYAQSFQATSTGVGHVAFLKPYTVESAWMTNDIPTLRATIGEVTADSDAFSIGIGKLLLAAVEDRIEDCQELLAKLRKSVTLSMTAASTSSLQASHEDLKRLHLLSEIDMLTTATRANKVTPALLTVLDKRLELLGTYNADKQGILAVRRVLLSSKSSSICTKHAASSWLTTARLARKEGNIESAYHAVLQASESGVKASKLEEAKLLWHDGHKRQAIYALEQAISAGVFDEIDDSQPGTISTTTRDTKQNIVAAKANLLYAKWLDSAGQTQSKEMTQRYQHATKMFTRWEKGHYNLGKHYARLLEAEKALPKSKQNPVYQSGELVKLVTENFLRSLPFGNKYWYETIPKILTLWLDLGTEVAKPSREDRHLSEQRSDNLIFIHKQLRKYVDRTPAYIFYSALPQMLSRVSHGQPEVWKELSHIIVRIASAYPAQALWSVLALAKATDHLRKERGKEIIARLGSGEVKSGMASDVRQLIHAGQRLSNALLAASEAPVEKNATNVSLSRDLHFKMHLAPCGLVVPIESTLNVNLPPKSETHHIRAYKPFVQERVTIQSFQDNVLVLSSLQRPKKLLLRGSDGKNYGLLCKPKDDLRKDQRLMEFNGIINRAMKRDAAGSKRRLYIKTYAVTPLSEESGCLEWVDGIKPIRDILLNLYNRKGIRPNYNEIRSDLNEACKSIDNVHIFEDKVQSKFPPALHEWFTEVFPEPETWFASRLKYARSAAVMSMVGHVLGLGDRHGENILLQESTGGVFHVDFNCLFDKGLTFEKPELVPFRLTRNMTDAMGPYGHEGPFRKSCEVTLNLLRQNKDTLMTILETFIHDPTTDFVGKKKKNIPSVPDTPQEILDSIEAKLKGLLRGETMPLSTEGYVDALIKEAVSSWNLCQMYIGWCAFL